MLAPHELQRLFAYNDWANREEVNCLRKINAPPDPALSILAHLVGTEWTWLGRLISETPRLEVWPALALEQCAAEVDRLASAWRDYIRSAVVEEAIHYTNTKGETFISRVDDVLMHVILHGSYHRGQIALLVRNAGEAPAYTDYIHCIRSEFIER